MKKFKILMGCMVGMLILGEGIYLTMKFIPPKHLPKVTSMPSPFKMDFMDKMLEIVDIKAAYAEEEDPAYNLLIKGLEHFREQEFDKAMEYFQKVVNDYPDNKWAPQALTHITIAWGYKYMFQGEKKEYLDNSIAELKRLINTYPETKEATRAYESIGASYFEIKDWQNAVIYFEQALEKFKEKNFSREDIADVIGKLAIAYYFIEKFEKSLNLFQKLLTEYSDTEQVKSTEGILHGSLGDVYGSLENYDEAIKHFKLALEKGVEGGIIDEGSLCFGIGEAYYCKKDKENAKIWYQKVVDNYPESKFYEEAKKRLEELKR